MDPLFALRLRGFFYGFFILFLALCVASAPAWDCCSVHVLSRPTILRLEVPIATPEGRGAAWVWLHDSSVMGSCLRASPLSKVLPNAQSITKKQP